MVVFVVWLMFDKIIGVFFNGIVGVIVLVVGMIGSVMVVDMIVSNIYMFEFLVFYLLLVCVILLLLVFIFKVIIIEKKYVEIVEEL